MEMPVTKQEFFNGFQEHIAEGYAHPQNFSRAGTDAIYDELERNSNREYNLMDIIHGHTEFPEWIALRDCGVSSLDEMRKNGWCVKIDNGNVVYRIDW